MTRTGKVAAGFAAILFVALLWAHAAGPDPRHTGAPGDDPLACATAGCHVGTLPNGGGGKVAVNFSNGQTYVPGAQQAFTIVITDAMARLYGFQMTARLESNLANGQAGDFTAGQGQIVLCAAGLGDAGIAKPSAGCPASEPVQFIEHYLQPFATNTITVQWTAPPTNVGNVHLYVAANAANGNPVSQPLGDHIYTASYVLTPLCANSTPTIGAGGVISAYDFNPNAGLASSTWLEIYGTNLSCTSRDWKGSDFSGSNAPTSLDGVSVFIDGISAYIDHVSPGQVNVQAPDDPNTGAGIQVVVKNSAGPSNPISMQKNAIAPALLAKSAFNTQGHQWVTALHTDNVTYVGKPGLVSGYTFAPAKVGDTITFYGIGFGPVMPATPAGTLASGQTTLVNQPNFRFGQTPAMLLYAGLSPGSVGLYQFNVKVPNLAPGDMPLNVDVGGVTINQNLFITVGP